MASNFYATEYGFRFPEITNITTIGDARYNGGFTIDFDRIGDYGSYVSETIVLCLVGVKGEQLDYANPEDPRWRIIKSGSKLNSPVSLSFNDILTDSSGEVRWSGNLKNHKGEIRRYSESAGTLKSEILKTKRPIHFAIFEKITCSYNGLTELYFRASSNELTAISLKKQVICDKHVNEMDVFWGPKIVEKGTIRRVAVDLAQRLKSDGTGRFQDRVVYVSTGNGHVVCYNYWTGEKLAETAQSLGSVELNAIAVDPTTGYLWTAVALGNGKVRVMALKRSGTSLVSARYRDIKCPNDSYTKAYKMIPSNMPDSTVASRITGGVVTKGADSKRWFTFIVNMEATISVSTDSTMTYKWADRMHFGSWHGANAAWCAPKFNGKKSYTRNKEYGVAANTDNVQGICAGVGNGVYVNGHTYYHEDWRYWNNASFWGYTQTGTACGGVFASNNIWYPSYGVDWVNKKFVKDEKTGKYKIMWASTLQGHGCWSPNTASHTLKECKEIENTPFPNDASNHFRTPTDAEKETVAASGYWSWISPSYSVPLYEFWMRYPANPSYKAEHYYKGHEDASDDGAHWCDFGLKKAEFELDSPTNYDKSRAKEMWNAALTATNVEDDFGNKRGNSERTYKPEAKWSGDPAIDYESAKGGLRAHIEHTTYSWKYNLGSHWYQLQDLGFIYCGNASLGNATGTSYSIGCNNAEFFRSNGVCEDHPKQLDGVSVASDVHFNYSNPTATPGDIGAVNTVSVHGFTYQKNILNGDNSSIYFSSICPANNTEHKNYRKIGSTYGWRGVASRTAFGPYRWGSSEDWGVNKAGFSIGGSYNLMDQPPVPKMSMHGLEQRLSKEGSLSNNTNWEIIQTDADYPNTTTANNYVYDIRPTGTPSDTSIARTMETSVIHATTSRPIKAAYDVSIDDVNRAIYECTNAVVVDKLFSPDSAVWDRCCKYKNRYIAALKQFTSFGNHKNTWQITEAYQLANSGEVWSSETWSKAYTAVRDNPGDLQTAIQSIYSFGETEKDFSNKKSKLFNCDPTGMDGIKCLGYCYTLRTQAHPLPTPPDGRLLVISSRVRNEVDCYVPFWQKSIIQPAKFEDISKKAFRGGDIEVDWYHRSRSSDDWQQTTYIGNAFYTSGELYDNHLHSIGVRISGASTTVDTVMEWGLSAAGYDHLATRHLMDVFSSGSYWPDEFILEFKDTPQRNKDYAKRSTKITFTDIQNVASGFYQHYENPDAWNGITVYGKPIKTKKDPESVPTKVHRWGQNVPTKQYQNFEYSSIHPDVYTWPGFPQEKSSTGMYVENNNYGPLANAYGHGTGWSKPNTVSFSAVSYDYPYGNPEVPGSDTMVFYFGMNDIHVYERWSTPAMCATSDDPSGGLSLWGECE